MSGHACTPSCLTELRRADLLDLDDCSLDGPHVRLSKGGSCRPLSRRPRPPGSQHHLIVDRHGTPRAVKFTRQPARLRVGGPGDAAAASPASGCGPRYDFDKYRRLLWKRGIKPLIARRGVAHGSGLGKVRWLVLRRCLF